MVCRASRLTAFVLGAGLLLPAVARCQIGNIVVTSAASFHVGMPPSGSIGTIFCTGLVVQRVVSAQSLPLPFSLAGVTVTIGGAPAPLFAVADLGGYQQINFQVPLEAVSSSPVVVSQGAVQGSATVNGFDSGTGDFFRLGDTQFGVFQHANDYSLVTSDNPAHPGEMIVAYATGLPTPTPRVPTGQPAPLSPLSYVKQSYSTSSVDTIALVINGPAFPTAVYLSDAVPASGDTTGELPIPFMGLTPGTVGLFQINFVFPQGVPSGNARIQLNRSVCTSHLFYLCDGGGGGETYQIYSQPVLIPVG